MVDLAGSERIAASGVTGARLAETKAINKSLSALGDVVAAIGAQERHVPYRNSKLTHLLQNCLGGHSKVLMVCCASAKAGHRQETLCSLRFAAKVNACQVGRATRNSGTKK